MKKQPQEKKRVRVELVFHIEVMADPEDVERDVVLKFRHAIESREISISKAIVKTEII